ncbi:MAG TPA: L-lactate dehydrogenase [Candidatus Krumholzibacteria bacterium]|nr:L-lactate dehydrogenase [Candidatus Krumholzibacteria bacterium]
MKVGIVGTGFVGSTVAFALVARGVGREVVLVDVNRERAEAEADDILHAVPFAEPLQVRAGDYDDLRGSRVVVIGAGVGQKPGETRLHLLARNARVFRDVVPSVLSAAPDALLIIASNPVDVMTHVASEFAADFGVPSRRVIGSGTMLDTARFRALLGRHLGIDSRHVHAYVVGEHGDSEVLAWSTARVGGIALDEFVKRRGPELGDDDRRHVEDAVRNAAYRIIAGKGATYYGVASALAHLTEVVLNDRRAIATVCTPRAKIAGVEDVTISMPHVIGGDGVIGAPHPLQLQEDEQHALEASARTVRRAIDDLHAEDAAEA